MVATACLMDGRAKGGTIIPGAEPSKIEARSPHNRAKSPPRCHFSKTSILRRLKRSCAKVFGGHKDQPGFPSALQPAVGENPFQTFWR